MGKLDMSAMLKKQTELSEGTSDYKFDKLKDGKNVRRILPPKGDRTMFYSEGYLHFGLGPEGKDTATCLSTFGEKCPICEYLESIKNSKNAEDKEFFQRARRVKRIYLNVLNRDSTSEEETPVVLPVGNMVLKQVVDIICDPDYGDITDFNEGRDITITRSGKGMNTKYSVIAKPKETLASESFTEEELDKELPDLDSLFVKKSYDDLKKLLEGAEDEEEEEDEDEEVDLEDLSTSELKELCKENGIKVPLKATRSKLISLLDALEEDEEEEEDEEVGEEVEIEDLEEEEDEDEDELMASIKQVVKSKRTKK